MKKLLLVIAAVAALTGCHKPPAAIVKVNSFDVEELFVHKGTQMNRFTDGGRTIYYTNCGDTTYHTGGKTSEYAQVTQGPRNDQSNR